MSNGTSTILIIASMTGLLTLQATLFGRVFDGFRNELTAFRNEITSRLDSIEGRLTRLENKVDRLDVRITELERFR